MVAFLPADLGPAALAGGDRPDRRLRLVRPRPPPGRSRRGARPTSRRSASAGSTARRARPASPRVHGCGSSSSSSLVALAAIIGGAVVFVGAVESLARSVGLDETLLSLVIAPIATELPEKLNSVIWIRRGKDTLALGNITGAMVFQAAIPTSIALLFASGEWSIGSGSWVAFASAGVALVSTVLIFLPMIRTGRLYGRRLLLGGVLYLAQLGLVVASLSGLVAPERGRPEAAGMMRPRTVAFRARGARTGAVPDADRQAHRDPPGGQPPSTSIR